MQIKLKIRQIPINIIFITKMRNGMIQFNSTVLPFNFTVPLITCLFTIYLINIVVFASNENIDSAIKHHKKGNYKQAISIYTNIINSSSKQSELYFNRGLAYSESFQYKEALNDFNQCLSLDAENDACYFNRSIVRSELGDMRGSLNDLNKTIELVPGDAKALFNRAILKFQLHDNKGAIKDATESKKLWKSMKRKKEYQQVNEFLDSIF